MQSEQNPKLPRGTGIQDMIRHDIICGAIPFGTRLQIEALASRYGVSHMPVREALRELRGEGLVVGEPNRGARVRQIDAAFVANVFDVRNALETLMTERAAARPRPDILADLEKTQQRFEAALERSDDNEVFAANREFHDIIYKAADNSEAFAIFKRQWLLVANLFQSYGHDWERMVGEVQDHRFLIHALTHGNAEAAASVVRTHVRRAKEDLLRRMAGAVGA